MTWHGMVSDDCISSCNISGPSGEATYSQCLGTKTRDIATFSHSSFVRSLLLFRGHPSYSTQVPSISIETRARTHAIRPFSFAISHRARPSICAHRARHHRIMLCAPSYDTSTHQCLVDATTTASRFPDRAGLPPTHEPGCAFNSIHSNQSSLDPFPRPRLLRRRISAGSGLSASLPVARRRVGGCCCLLSPRCAALAARVLSRNS